jgi:hypothetical protein
MLLVAFSHSAFASGEICAGRLCQLSSLFRATNSRAAEPRLNQTAKLNGVEPMAWLTDVLERFVSGRTKAHELQDLLPWNWRDPSSSNAALAA